MEYNGITYVYMCILTLQLYCEIKKRAVKIHA